MQFGIIQFSTDVVVERFCCETPAVPIEQTLARMVSKCSQGLGFTIPNMFDPMNCLFLVLKEV